MALLGEDWRSAPWEASSSKGEHNQCAAAASHLLCGSLLGCGGGLALGGGFLRNGRGAFCGCGCHSHPKGAVVPGTPKGAVVPGTAAKHKSASRKAQQVHLATLAAGEADLPLLFFSKASIICAGAAWIIASGPCTQDKSAAVQSRACHWLTARIWYGGMLKRRVRAANLLEAVKVLKRLPCVLRHRISLPLDEILLTGTLAASVAQLLNLIRLLLLGFGHDDKEGSLRAALEPRDREAFKPAQQEHAGA